MEFETKEYKIRRTRLIFNTKAKLLQLEFCLYTSLYSNWKTETFLFENFIAVF